MVSDIYAKIREALEMGPTPGPWEWKEGQSIITREWDGKDWPIASVEQSRLGWHENRRCEGLEAGANAAVIAACDPDTIRELLAERDALAAENERLKEEMEYLTLKFETLKRAYDLERQRPIQNAGGKEIVALGEALHVALVALRKIASTDLSGCANMTTAEICGALSRMHETAAQALRRVKENGNGE